MRSEDSTMLPGLDDLLSAAVPRLSRPNDLQADFPPSRYPPSRPVTHRVPAEGIGIGVASEGKVGCEGGTITAVNSPPDCHSRSPSRVTSQTRRFVKLVGRPVPPLHHSRPLHSFRSLPESGSALTTGMKSVHWFFSGPIDWPGNLG